MPEKRKTIPLPIENQFNLEMLKSSSAETPLVIDILKGRWEQLETFLNTIEGLRSMAISYESDNHVGKHVHLGIRRTRGYCFIVGGMSDEGKKTPSELTIISSLSLETLFECVEAISVLLETISEDTTKRVSSVYQAISKFDMQIDELGIDIWDVKEEDE